MFDLTGKTALVTGSTQGIGFEIAKLLADRGAKVFVSGASSEKKCIDASAKIRNSVPVRADLRSDADIEQLYEKTGDVDILVLNASIQYKRHWDEYSTKELDDQLTCNLMSSYYLIKKYTDGMKKKKWGRIVTIGSVNQYNQHPTLSFYAITKAALFKMVQNIAGDLAPFGITVNNVAPGAIATPRNDDVLNNEELKKQVEQKIPCGYVGIPADVAPSVLFLCSDEARYVTGAEILVDGGLHL
ncbi:MAG: SDR family oxidoreductase [Ruminococcaceae bacterium]|nr:SDR family oxidoreductase [Oscillospiraceae bacterium]